MELRRGISLGLAPRFQSSLAWIDRVQINGGIAVDAGHFYARRDWRRPRDAELALLLADGADVSLVNLPSHVRRPWSAMADDEDKADSEGECYRAFVDGVIQFLRFKQVPLPSRCRVDVAVSRPGQPSTRWDAGSGCPGGLDFNRDPGNAAFERVAGIINLGDEPTHLVFLNVAPSAMANMLGGSTGAAPGPDLLRGFFTTRATYPLIRVRLEAGDGLWLPASGIVYDVCTLDKDEIDVALTIRGGAESEA